MIVEIREDGYPNISCDVGTCHHTERFGRGFEDVEKARASFQQHVKQHEPGRAPDIWVTITATGRCSSCGKYIECEVDDEELVWCVCGTSWDLYGTKGRTDRKDD